ncbi:uncharacterized protein LOC115152375 [Salmo trutta]|uniref:uncharacterized protein LOC115152375 n=1 Tax=Salmo trutta TaxID=8032 RepID=UPI0011310FD4|nr:uncharacterized protein LOC115152375 [Salmo trutta]
MQKKRTITGLHVKEEEKDSDYQKLHNYFYISHLDKGILELLAFGGVGRNLADSLNRMGQRPLFISAIGTDSHSDAVLNYSQHMSTSDVARLQEQRNTTYCAVMTENGDLSLGLGDMLNRQRITEQYLVPSSPTSVFPVLSACPDPARCPVPA